MPRLRAGRVVHCLSAGGFLRSLPYAILRAELRTEQDRIAGCP